ncbi:NUDIX hydrolase [Ottowia thiooxydans]|uniref:NUDIX hydrolase n=1 Tax=Ottowia thiooxydans TaxID=219182 RepID=UPI0004258E38|nr:CoA pyrophosphatase [Ottowia thiooxydans]
MRIDDAFKSQISSALMGWERSAADPTRSSKRAAVALTILDEGFGADLAGIATPGSRSESPAMLLTRRAAGLRKHAGQWALPGGAIDPGESAEEAALRELQEEVGLDLPTDCVVGKLDDFVTHSGFCITPVVVWAGRTEGFTLNEGEVASAHRIPLSEFMRPDAPLLESIEDSTHPVLRMPVGSGWIAAPTGAIIFQFTEVCLRGRATRVGHFEQPLFARR